MDYDLATEQAAALNEAWKEKQIGSDEDMFLEILGRQSRAQIQVQYILLFKAFSFSLNPLVHAFAGGGGGGCKFWSPPEFWWATGRSQTMPASDTSCTCPVFFEGSQAYHDECFAST